MWDGEWHHIAFTADGRHLRFYVDGLIVKRADGVSATPLFGYALGYEVPGHNDLTIGGYAGDCEVDGVEAGSGRPAENVDIFYALTAHRDLTIGQLRNGSCTIGVEADVDGVRLWSRALTAPEVAQRFIGSQPPSCSPPSLVIEPVAPALEGTTINLPILTDAASFEVSWGDGNETSTTTHVYADDGVYAVTVRAIGSAGCETTKSASVTIANASPVILGASATGTLRPIGSSIDAAVVFSDAGVQDTHTVAWSWGDGSTTTGPSAASHVYTAPGVYRVEVTVNDDDGGSTATEAGTVVIMTPARDR